MDRKILSDLDAAHEKCERLFASTVLAGITADLIPEVLFTGDVLGKGIFDSDVFTRNLSEPQKRQHKVDFAEEINRALVTANGIEIKALPSPAGAFKIELRQPTPAKNAAATQAILARLQQQGIHGKHAGDQVAFVLTGEPLRHMQAFMEAYQERNRAEANMLREGF